MSTTIGNVEVPFISEIDSDTNVPTSELKDVHETAPTVVKHQPDSERLTIQFVISEMLDTTLTMQEQRNGIKSLEEKEIANSAINYMDWDGWLAVEDVNLGRATGEPAIQEGTINAIYLPSEDYNL